MKSLLMTAGIVIGLGGFALAFYFGPTPKPENITVIMNYNGYLTEIATSAPDVATFLLLEIGDYSKMIVTPDPSTKLVAGDTISIQDTVARSLDPVVSKNFQIATAPPPPPAPTIPKVVDKPKSKVYSGLATWYRHGSGLTTANREFPKGTKLKVIAVNSGKSVEVIVNDYGPQAVTGISLDLNAEAFEKIAPLGAGKISIKYYKL